MVGEKLKNVHYNYGKMTSHNEQFVFHAVRANERVVSRGG